MKESIWKSTSFEYHNNLLHLIETKDEPQNSNPLDIFDEFAIKTIAPSIY
jgi:hypothetical protein